MPISALRFPLSAFILSLLVSLPVCAADPAPWPTAPTGEDYTQVSLRRYQQELTARYGSYRDIPLDVKADYFTWELWRYHATAFDQVYNHVLLPDQVGPRPQIYPDRDNSTWAGSYLAALSYEYAAKRDRATLGRIGIFLRGMHFYFQVTGQPGLPARCVNQDGGIVDPPMKAHPYKTSDGTLYYYEAEPAKGGFNQIAGGYAALMMLVYPDLPDDLKRLARQDVTDLVLQVIDHDYRATYADGSRTKYGDMTPLVGTVGVPFNAQVAYEIVALGFSFPPDDPRQRERIVDQFRRLRGEHHVYYEEPWSLIQPQRVGASPLVKGMNDRNHVVCAAFTGLALELDYARRTNTAWNPKFMFQLGQTVYLAMGHPDMPRNALCNFMWAALAQNPAVFESIVTHKRNTAQTQIEQGLAVGVEQLRRFKLDRFVYPGRLIETPDLRWVDEFRPDDTYWKESPRLAFQPTGANTNECFCAMDYLYAYWLLRYYGLDRHPSLVRQNIPVLQRTPDLHE